MRMVFRPERRRNARAGFTLLELLLVVVLLMALLGAVAFNFGSLKQGADLDEGAGQFEALLRMAAAQAANSGRAVQVRFDDAVTSTNAIADTFDTNAVALRVVQEADPVLQPGVFVDLVEARSLIEEIVERVRLASVRSGSFSDVEVASTNEVSTNVVNFVQEGPLARPPVVFYPDGSSDEAEIVLASIEPTDMRRIAFRLKGVTGEIARESFLVDAEGMAMTNSVEELKDSQTGTNSLAEDWEY